MKITNPELITGPLIIDIESYDLSSDDKLLIQNPFVGGVILFSRNYENKHQLKKLCREIKAISSACLIAVDHEGGRVQRFKKDFSRIPCMQKLGQVYLEHTDKSLKLAEDFGWLMAAELIDCGVDLSFAPVLDVDDSFSDIIGDRAFSNDPKIVTHLADSFISGMRQAGMKATGKHFPGHGGVKQDSHCELPVDDRTLSEIEHRDLTPFKALLPKLAGIMPAHIVYPQIDPHPVGFSRWWLQTYLRESLNYNGIIFSDDLSMEGAAVAGAYSERAKFAISAGCDALLVCNHRHGAIEVLAEIERNEKMQINSRLISMLAANQAHESDIMRHPRWQGLQAMLSETEF